MVWQNVDQIVDQIEKYVPQLKANLEEMKKTSEFFKFYR